ncbi:MAG: (Fe-S)-binding protein [Desulfuromonadales bacterium]|nr:(Fe-S)-binding protein [Desulfuromonadales bacterium]
MSKHKNLHDLEDQIRQCVKCGACQAHCPVFAEHKREPAVARGKIALAHALLDQDLPLDERFVADMSKCLLCGSCFDKCPNLVPTDEIVAAARREIAERRGLSNFAKVVGQVVKRPGLMKIGLKGAGAVSRLLFRKVPQSSGLRLRFPAPWIAPDRVLPEIPTQTFRDRHPQFIPGGEGRPTVAFFTGCMLNYMYPQLGDALLKCLKFLDISVYIPPDQGCCGLPSITAGDGRTVEELAERNLAAFSQGEPHTIITACASCNIGMGRHFASLGERQAEIGGRVRDALVVLEREGLARKLARLPKKEQRIKVAYHDPCHLRTQGITKEPRALLRALPGVEFVEMEGADRCCGLGGTYSVYHWETSKKIGDRKAPGIEKSGAELVATACPGCMMQLQDIITRAGLPQKVVHVLELVARDLPE